MNEQVALHTAARRYCTDRYVQVTERYGTPSEGGRPEAQAISGRHYVLQAILLDIETIDPDGVATTHEMREFLLLAGQTAVNRDLWTTAPHWAVDVEAAIDEERALFCAYIQGLSAESLRRVEPLPYERALTVKERDRLWERLETRWGLVQGAWYPLIGADLPPHVLALEAEWFYQAIPLATLHQILAAHGVARVWELREWGIEYELDLEAVEPYYTGAEGYWTTDEMDWLIYASHESSLTLAGTWLIAAVQDVWPDWERHRYTTWNYEHPPKAGPADADAPLVERVASAVVTELPDDFVGLWQIIADVRQHLPVGDAEPVREMALRVVEHLLVTGRARPGMPTPDGRRFVPWGISTEQALRRINTEWDALGREPSIGDIVWFDAPAAGNGR